MKPIEDEIFNVHVPRVRRIADHLIHEGLVSHHSRAALEETLERLLAKEEILLASDFSEIYVPPGIPVLRGLPHNTKTRAFRLGLRSVRIQKQR